jgi:hypothetical protein
LRIVSKIGHSRYSVLEIFPDDPICFIQVNA